MKSIIKWVGGKSKLAPKLVPLFPRHEGYVEVFVGSGAVLFAKGRSKWEVINDFDSNLVNFWTVVKDKNKEFKESFEYEIISREKFDKYKEKYLKGEYKDDVERAHIFYYLVKAGFGGDMKNPCFGVGKDRSRLRLEDIDKDIKMAHNRLKQVIIENDSFENIVPRFDTPKTMFFMDPPYRNTKGYVVGDFTDEQYLELSDLCKKMKGKFMLTINNDEYIRDLFGEFNILDNSVFYSMSRSKGTRRDFEELIITNYNPLNI